MAKRLSLSEKLNKIHTLGDEVIFEMVANLQKTVDATVGFRWQATTTQARQDLHLRLYRDFVRMILFPGNNDVSDTQAEEAGFISDSTKLGKYMRSFLIWVYQNAEPRSRLAGKHIAYRSLVQYRQSMLYWANRICHQKNLSQPNKAVLYNEMTEGMRHVERHSRAFRNQPAEKTAIGLEELRQLLDYELANNTSIENSEQHQLAWCLARLIALRPGSFGPSGSSKDYMQWKDVTFQRQTGAASTVGAWKCVVHVRILKTNAQDPERVGPAGWKSLKCRLTPPSATNIIFSVPHRLLVIALRRNLLYNVNSLDDLFNSNMHYIQIKKEHLHDPIFYSSRAAGTGIDMTKPMTAKALTFYLSLRGQALGYRFGLSFYSLRRKTATDLVHRIGRDATRELMGHTADSSKLLVADITKISCFKAILTRNLVVLEQHYFNLFPTLDLTAAALNEPIGPEGYSAAMAEDSAPLARGKLEKERLDRTRGAALQQLVEQLIIDDPDFPAHLPTDHPEVKNYKRRVSRIAYASLLEQEHDAQEEQMTHQDWEARRALANASRFKSEVVRRAKDALASNQHISAEREAATDAEVRAIEEAASQAENVQEEEVEQDVEDLFDEVSPETNEITLNCNPEESLEADAIADEAIPYHISARAMMEILLNNSFCQYVTWAQKDQRCTLCLNDPTVDDEMKEKLYKKTDHIKYHLNSQFHSSYHQKLREFKIRQKSHPLLKWECPYCSDHKAYAEQKFLVRHIEQSNAVTHGEHHDQQKADAGWYDEGFYPVARGIVKPQDRAMTHDKLVDYIGLGPKAMKRLSRNLAKEWSHIPLPAGVEYGWSSSETPGPCQQSITFSNQFQTLDIPEHQTSIIKVTDQLDPTDQLDMFGDGLAALVEKINPKSFL